MCVHCVCVCVCVCACVCVCVCVCCVCVKKEGESNKDKCEKCSKSVTLKFAVCVDLVERYLVEPSGGSYRSVPADSAPSAGIGSLVKGSQGHSPVTQHKTNHEPTQRQCLLLSILCTMCDLQELKHDCLHLLIAASIGTHSYVHSHARLQYAFTHSRSPHS